MPKYNVHLYREMRVKYLNVDAATPEEAAQKVKDINPEMCDYETELHECEGQSFGCVVDELDPSGVHSFLNEERVEFEEGKLRDAAPDLLEALEKMAEMAMHAPLMGHPYDQSDIDDAFTLMAKLKTTP